MPRHSWTLLIKGKLLHDMVVLSLQQSDSDKHLPEVRISQGEKQEQNRQRESQYFLFWQDKEKQNPDGLKLYYEFKILAEKEVKWISDSISIKVVWKIKN